MYVSNITLLPKERIIEIILADPDFIIEHEYILNKKLFTTEKIAKALCPKCNNPLAPNWEYCPNCGYVLN